MVSLYAGTQKLMKTVNNVCWLSYFAGAASNLQRKKKKTLESSLFHV